jgi:hypothetical protein
MGNYRANWSKLLYSRPGSVVPFAGSLWDQRWPGSGGTALGMTDELAALIERIGKNGFLLHSFQGDRHGPDVFAAVRDFGDTADVMIMFDADRAVAYRTPTGPGIDIFAPAQVFWSYASGAVWTLRALLTVAAPGHPDAPAELTPAPRGLGVPCEWRERVRVRKR